MDQLENYLLFAHNLFWNVYRFGTYGRPDIQWSVDKLARSITNWTKAVGNTAKQCRLVRAVTKWTKACDLIHSSHMWSQTILSCGKHCQTIQRRIVLGLRFCRWPRRFRINIGRNLMHFRKPNICASQLDVQETDLRFTQFYGSWNDLSRCRFTHGWDSRFRSLGFSDWRVSSLTKPNQQNQIRKRATVKPAGNSSIMRKQIPATNTNLDLTNIDHVPPSGTHSFQCYVVCLCGQWSRVSHDY